ncbi:hypothetical protein [Burkholderia phage BCSR5]|nr:hypothetical protein [Burkholderia phage BCSR5]
MQLLKGWKRKRLQAKYDGLLIELAGIKAEVVAIDRQIRMTETINELQKQTLNKNAKRGAEIAQHLRVLDRALWAIAPKTKAEVR